MKSWRMRSSSLVIIQNPTDGALRELSWSCPAGTRALQESSLVQAAPWVLMAPRAWTLLILGLNPTLNVLGIEFPTPGKQNFPTNNPHRDPSSPQGKASSCASPSSLTALPASSQPAKLRWPPIPNLWIIRALSEKCLAAAISHQLPHQTKKIK